jgi:hypothetical protein
MFRILPTIKNNIGHKKAQKPQNHFKIVPSVPFVVKGNSLHKAHGA